MFDLIIRGARVVDSKRYEIADIGITDGVIQAIKMDLSSDAAHVVDASGLVLMPGGIDPHVHFNEPGRTDWEGIETGARALAKGGMTTYFDMPLNSSPVTNTVEDYNTKRQLMDEKSIVNGYLWGGLTPDNLEHLESLADAGVIGFKAFMSNSGIDEFRNVDDYSLYRGMEIIAGTGKVLALHAENDGLTAGMGQAAPDGSIRAYLSSRPVISEVEAIQRALLFAQETGCKLHIVHVSSVRGVEVLIEAQKKSIDVTWETCTHYLTLTDEDVERIGAAAKCAPPIRSQKEQDGLWMLLLRGNIPMVTSDHSPAPMSMKEDANFFKIWGGIAGCQSTLPLLLTVGYHQRHMSLQQIVSVTSYNAAQRFGLHSKGRIEVGADADLVLLNMDEGYTLQADDLEYRHKISPYIGRDFIGNVHSTFVNGAKVYG